jgi:hypothetical protein
VKPPRQLFRQQNRTSGYEPGVVGSNPAGRAKIQ